MSELRRAFARFDRDGSGSIEVGELEALLEELTDGAAESDALVGALAKLATAKPDRVTWDELERWWDEVAAEVARVSHAPPVEPKSNADEYAEEASAESKIDARPVFDRFDTDGSGAIDRKELARLLEALGRDPSDEDLEAIFAKVDANGSGRIAWKEFEAWWGDEE